MADYVRFQVKSSGKWLKILDSSTTGSLAGQGSLPTGDNYLWAIIDSGIQGWSLIQVKSSGQYLNIQDGGNSNGTVACQNPLPNPITDNFLWQIQAPDETGWSKIQVKNSTDLYLNIREPKQAEDAVACQGDNPSSTNFLWMQSPAKDPINVTVTMTITDCSGIYALSKETKNLSTEQANQFLSMGDDNNGALEGQDQSSFETKLNPGSIVTWRPNIASQDSINSGFQVVITGVSYEQGQGSVLGSVMQDNGSLQAQVLWTAMPLDQVNDNESYTITFTVDDGTHGPRTFSFDPKIKINPSN